MAGKGKAHIVARIQQLRAEGFTKNEAGKLAYREAGQGKSKAKGIGGAGKRAARGVGFAGITPNLPAKVPPSAQTDH